MLKRLLKFDPEDAILALGRLLIVWPFTVLTGIVGEILKDAPEIVRVAAVSMLFFAAAMVSFWMAFVVATAGAGLVLAASIKLKIPLVNPNGPLPVPLFYALMWAILITFALASGSEIIRWGPRTSVLSARLDREIIFFFFESWLMLTIAMLIARRLLPTSAAGAISLMVAGCASIVYSIAPPQGFGLLTDLEFTARNVADTVASPVTAVTLVGSFGIAELGQRIWTWLVDSQGDMFVITRGVAKILWCLTVLAGGVQALRRLLRLPQEPDERVVVSRTLTTDERLIFMRALAGLCTVALTGAIALLFHKTIDSQVFWGVNLLLGVVGFFSIPFQLLQSRQEIRTEYR